MRLKADGNLDLDWRKRGYRDPQKGCYHELRSCVICNSAFELQARCPDRHPPPSGLGCGQPRSGPHSVQVSLE
jgi:hypothetical protein